MLPLSILELAQKIRNLPGMGAKSSQKLALDLLQSKQEDFDDLIEAIKNSREKTFFCKQCGFFAEGHLCNICSNSSRNQSQICIVEKEIEVISLEKSESYRGVYHVLKKLISPLDNVFAENTTISSLIDDRLIKLTKDGQSVELILFLKPSFATEATTAYLKELLKEKKIDHLVSITRMAQGLPLYYNPETLDIATVTRALEDRRVI
jgi:recombination protein RecR